MNDTAIAIAQVIINLVSLYLIAGLIFAVPFLIFAVQRLDEGTKWDWGFGNIFDGIGLRLLLAPGICVFWPLFALRLVRGKGTPYERNAHRDLAKHS
ncbi:MAG: hypothetical protein AB4372_34430 [Xenococcus sp. (in: cyanobacteria)]